MELQVTEKERRIIAQVRLMDEESKDDILAIATGFAKEFPVRLQNLSLVPIGRRLLSGN